MPVKRNALDEQESLSTEQDLHVGTSADEVGRLLPFPRQKLGRRHWLREAGFLFASSWTRLYAFQRAKAMDTVTSAVMVLLSCSPDLMLCRAQVGKPSYLFDGVTVRRRIGRSAVGRYALWTQNCRTVPGNHYAIRYCEMGCFAERRAVLRQCG